MYTVSDPPGAGKVRITMNAAVPYLLAVLMGYLFGCSNMAFYLSRLRGVDMRSSGSGNLGASNAMVLMGWASGVLVAIHDIAKGTLAGWLAGRLFPSAPFIGLVACVGAVLGHNFPFYLGFKGGKGFATYFGMVVFFDWKFALSLALANVVITLITDYIVIATMTTSFPCSYTSPRGGSRHASSWSPP